MTMGDLRSIRVFVLGEAKKPGSYTVSGLSTMTNALFVSGGVKKIGSLRNIQLKRDGHWSRRSICTTVVARRYERRSSAVAGRRDLHSSHRQTVSVYGVGTPSGDL